ncbi:MAG TPA: ThuA domain-containing protein, partial [Flavitalea sp.]|nr:ThuA domain-containing protein [Flavitalea sp.]
DSVHVIANVDESSYMPASDIKMGDHPVIWSNPRYLRNLYIFMGHGPDLFDNTAYTTLFRNAISFLHTR